jgi:hypothetical protein
VVISTKLRWKYIAEGFRSSEMWRWITGWLEPYVSADNVTVSCSRVGIVLETNMFSHPQKKVNLQQRANAQHLPSMLHIGT